MASTVDQVWRDYNTQGVPASGDHKPVKPEIRALLKQIQNSSGSSVTRATFTVLSGVTPPTENYMGIVLDDPDPTKNGYYSRSGSAWFFERGFPDTFGLLVSVGGTGNAVTATVSSGVNPSNVDFFALIPTAANTDATTLAISGGTAKSVLNANGNPLSPGEFGVGKGVILFDDGAGNYRIAGSAINSVAKLASISGSANAITANTIGADPSLVTLFWLTPTLNNTGASTLRLNGGTALPLNGFDGSPLGANYIQAGKPVLLYDNGDSTYRLLVDHRFQVLADETSDARDEAVEAAAIATGVATSILIAENTFASRTAAMAWEPVAGPDYIRTAGYYSAGDGGSALYKKVVSEPAHAGKFSITLDDGVTVVWYEIGEPAVCLRQMGAKADGSDDTTAIVSWLNMMSYGFELLSTGGDFKFTSALAAPAVDKITITASNGKTNRLVYDGEPLTADLFTVGSVGTPTKMNISGLSVDSLKVMTGGYAIVVNEARDGFEFYDFFPGKYSNTDINIYNGMLLNNCQSGTVEQYKFRPQAKGIAIVGKAGEDSGGDIWFDKGRIVGGTEQIHVGGGVGGVYMMGHLGYGGLVNFLVDESIVARRNREIFLSDMCCLDAADEALLRIDVSEPGLLMNCNAWLSGGGYFTASPGDGIDIVSAPSSRFSIASGHIKGNASHAITVADATAEINIAPTTFLTNNVGYGLHASVATENVRFLGKSEYNTTGNVHSNVKSYKSSVPAVSASGGSGWLFAGALKLRQQGAIFEAEAKVTATAAGTASGVLVVALPSALRSDVIGMGSVLNTGLTVFVRGDTGDSFLTISGAGGAFPLTTNGHELRFAIDLDLV